MLLHLPYSAFERDAFIRTAEVALSVSTRHHFFMWLRLHLHRFVPHELALCHLPQGANGQAATLVFHSVPMQAELLKDLSQPGERLWQALRERWLCAGRRPVFVSLSDDMPAGAEVDGLRLAGVERLLVHGVDASACLRPEVMFAFVSHGIDADDASAAGLALWMPYLYLSAVRSLTAAESTRGSDGPMHLVRQGAGGSVLSAREVQVLNAVRNAKRTAEIATHLGISPLTVKNHMRKIMTKLGARSRTHAVAEAMARQIIS